MIAIKISLWTLKNVLKITRFKSAKEFFHVNEHIFIFSINYYPKTDFESSTLMLQSYDIEIIASVCS